MTGTRYGARAAGPMSRTSRRGRLAPGHGDLRGERPVLVRVLDGGAPHPGQGLAVVPNKAIAEHLRLFRHGVNAALSAVRRVPGAASKQPPALHLLEYLKHREADVLRFLTDTTIPPTSNQAGRDLRPAKTQQKISGRLRSENAARDRYAIRGYAATAAKHGHQTFTAIRDALAGNPWIPPVPDTA